MIQSKREREAVKAVYLNLFYQESCVSLLHSAQSLEESDAKLRKLNPFALPAQGSKPPKPSCPQGWPDLKPRACLMRVGTHLFVLIAASDIIGRRTCHHLEHHGMLCWVLRGKEAPFDGCIIVHSRSKGKRVPKYVVARLRSV